MREELQTKSQMELCSQRNNEKKTKWANAGKDQGCTRERQEPGRGVPAGTRTRPGLGAASGTEPAWMRHPRAKPTLSDSDFLAGVGGTPYLYLMKYSQVTVTYTQVRHVRMKTKLGLDEELAKKAHFKYS